MVLKISFPHDEARHEAAALRAWHGHGVPRLLGAHEDDWALLLERIEPGTPLSRAPGSPQGAPDHRRGRRPVAVVRRW